MHRQPLRAHERPTSLVFWAAYVLTRPLGATPDDTLTKPHARWLLLRCSRSRTGRRDSWPNIAPLASVDIGAVSRYRRRVQETAFACGVAEHLGRDVQRWGRQVARYGREVARLR